MNPSPSVLVPNVIPSRRNTVFTVPMRRVLSSAACTSWKTRSLWGIVTQAPLTPPDWLFTPRAPEQLADIIRAHLPLLAWLVN